MMATRSIRRREEPALGSCASKRDDLYGISFAELIKASGLASRINRPDTCSHSTKPPEPIKALPLGGRPHMLPLGSRS